MLRRRLITHPNVDVLQLARLIANFFESSNAAVHEVLSDSKPVTRKLVVEFGHVNKSKPTGLACAPDHASL